MHALYDNVLSLNAWVKGRVERDDHVEGYLASLHLARPAKGEQVKGVF